MDPSTSVGQEILFHHWSHGRVWTYVVMAEEGILCNFKVTGYWSNELGEVDKNNNTGNCMGSEGIEFRL